MNNGHHVAHNRINYQMQCPSPSRKAPRDTLSTNSNLLPVVSEIHDLGIYIDNKLSFDGYIIRITRKAYAVARFSFKCSANYEK